MKEVHFKLYGSLLLDLLSGIEISFIHPDCKYLISIEEGLADEIIQLYMMKLRIEIHELKAMVNNLSKKNQELYEKSRDQKNEQQI